MRASPRQPVVASKAWRSRALSVAVLSFPVLIFFGLSMRMAVALNLLAPGSLCSFGALQNAVSVSCEGVVAASLELVQLADWVRAASRRIDETGLMEACV